LKNRDLSADALKAFAIFAVVFIHSSHLLSGESELSKYLIWVFRAGVPIFIILWAYFLESSLLKKTSYYVYIKLKFTHLLIIFLFWSLLYFFITVNWQELTIKSLITKYWTGVGWAGQYYFIVLFQLLIFYPLIRKIYDIKELLVVTIFLSILIYVYYGYGYIQLPAVLKLMGDRPFFLWLPYVFCGIHMARNPAFKIPVLFSLLIVFIAIEYSILNTLHKPHSAYIIPSVLISSIIFTVAVFRIPLKLSTGGKTGRLISYIGQNTMTLFVVNPLLILFLSPFFKPVKNIRGSEIFELSMTFLSAIIIFGIALFIAALINRTRWKGIIN